jgi:tetratricopeptide (TPR) repeat protein
MRLYYADLIRPIDLKHEDVRLSQLEFVEEARVRQAKVLVPAKPPELQGANKTLDDAEQLYTARNLEPARQLYLKVLEETPEKPMHAKAYYGLARVAALEKNPELAERLFQKTLECEPEPPVRAWTLVYLGRLSDAAGDHEQAVKHYQEALAVEGASPAAHQAAEQGAQRSLPKPN